MRNKKGLTFRTKEIVKQILFNNNIRRIERRLKTDRISIAIFIMLGENWNSFSTMYSTCINSNRIDIDVVVFPIFNGESYNIDKYMETLEYFKKVGISIIPAFDLNYKQWDNTIDYKYDYIFYDEPYGYCGMYNVRYMSRKSKICYIPYGFILTKSNELLELVLSRSFLGYLYIFFASWDYVETYAKKQYEKIGKKNHYVWGIGYPRFDLIPKEQICDSENFTILWIPRYTIDGYNLKDPSSKTSFFEYNEAVTERIKMVEDEHWIIRPHPAAFNNYVKTGRMTKEQVQNYVTMINCRKNAEIDVNKDYNESFSRSSVLLADFSSLIIEYIISGKPIIYCGDINAIPIIELRECMYIADSWEKTQIYISDLRKGIDPLSERRKKYANTLKNEGSIGKKVVDIIVQDYDNAQKHRKAKAGRIPAFCFGGKQ